MSSFSIFCFKAIPTINFFNNLCSQQIIAYLHTFRHVMIIDEFMNLVSCYRT